MLQLHFSDKHIQKIWEGGVVKLCLITIIRWLMLYICIDYPRHNKLIVCDVDRLKFRWFSLTTKNMKEDMIKNILSLLNSVNKIDTTVDDEKITIKLK